MDKAQSRSDPFYSSENGEIKKTNPAYILHIHKPLSRLFTALFLSLIIAAGAILSFRAYMAERHAHEARTKLATGYKASATQHARLAVALWPQNAYYHSLLALILEKRAAVGLNRIDYLNKAAGELHRALTLNPIDGDHWLQLAKVSEKIETLSVLIPNLQVTKEIPPATDCFNKAIKLDPHNIYYLISAAAYYAKRGHRDKAENLFAQAWRISPQAINRHYIAWERRQEALDGVVESYLSKQVAAGTGDKLTFYCLGGLYEARGKYDAANKIYRLGLKTTGGAKFERLIKRVAYKSREK